MPQDGKELRKLAAIMFTDMVGYSAFMESNEGLALQLLEEHRQLLRSLFSKHEGSEIKTIGDGFLVEFSSALAAVQCGIEIQEAIDKRNSKRRHISNRRRVSSRRRPFFGASAFSRTETFGIPSGRWQEF
jgi:class 3 adenylate cyclase